MTRPLETNPKQTQIEANSSWGHPMRTRDRSLSFLVMDRLRVGLPAGAGQWVSLGGSREGKPAFPQRALSGGILPNWREIREQSTTTRF